MRDPIVGTKQTRDGGYKVATVDPGVTDKRLLVDEAEFAGMLRTVKRQGCTLSSVLRQLFDGRTAVQALTKSSPAKATGAHVRVIASITPLELQERLTLTETANGFANQFLVAWVRASKLLPDAPAIAEAVLELLAGKLRYAVEFPRGVGLVQRSDAADRVWRAVYPELVTGR